MNDDNAFDVGPTVMLHSCRAGAALLHGPSSHIDIGSMAVNTLTCFTRTACMGHLHAQLHTLLQAIKSYHTLAAHAWTTCQSSDKKRIVLPVRRCGGMCIGEGLFLCAFVGAIVSWLEYDMRPVYVEVNASANSSYTAVPGPGSCRLNPCASHESNADLLTSPTTAVCRSPNVSFAWCARDRMHC